MAMADVVVALGPRNQRRFARSAIVVALAGAVVAVGYFLLPSSHSGPGSAAGRARVPVPTFVTDRIVYGMSKAAVLHRIGQPAKTVGACWQYDENEKIRGGADTLDAQRVCFLGGVYAYDYSKIDGKWYYPTVPFKVP